MAGHKAIRHHDFSAGHRVVGHENKCAFLHGHNYRVWFHCCAELDDMGRVLDFGVIKERLCDWLESHWDHKFLLWEDDPLRQALVETDSGSIVIVPFNPTAENMAQYLVTVIGSVQLQGTGVVLHKVVIDETRKCSASYEISD